MFLSRESAPGLLALVVFLAGTTSCFQRHSFYNPLQEKAEERRRAGAGLPPEPEAETAPETPAAPELEAENGPGDAGPPAPSQDPTGSDPGSPSSESTGLEPLPEVNPAGVTPEPEPPVRAPSRPASPDPGDAPRKPAPSPTPRTAKVPAAPSGEVTDPAILANPDLRDLITRAREDSGKPQKPLRRNDQKVYEIAIKQAKVLRGMNRKEVISSWGFFGDLQEWTEGETVYELFIYEDGRRVYLRQGHVFHWQK